MNAMAGCNYREQPLHYVRLAARVKHLGKGFDFWFVRVPGMAVCLTRGLESIMIDQVPRSVRERRSTLWDQFWWWIRFITLLPRQMAEFTGSLASYSARWSFFTYLGAIAIEPACWLFRPHAGQPPLTIVDAAFTATSRLL